MSREAKAIYVQFVGFPTIYDFFRGDSVKHNFSGKTLIDLVGELISEYGEGLRLVLWDDNVNGLDPSVQIMVNQKYLKGADVDKFVISQGDKVIFLKLLAGG